MFSVILVWLMVLKELLFMVVVRFRCCMVVGRWVRLSVKIFLFWVLFCMLRVFLGLCGWL